jgi:hypothetical protein
MPLRPIPRLLSAYLWMGYDPTQDVGFLNAGQATAILWPLILQPAGGTVAIHTLTPTPSNLLEVAGTTRTTGAINTSALNTLTATVLGHPLVSGSQWTQTSPNHITYTGPVQTATTTAQVYHGLPVATPSSQGIVQVGPTLPVNASPTVRVAARQPVRFLSCRCAATSTSWTAGNYLVALTQVYAMNAASKEQVCNPPLAGMYAISLSGAESPRPPSRFGSMRTLLGTTSTQGGSVSALFVTPLSTSDVVTLTSQNTTGLGWVGCCFVLRFRLNDWICVD